jgi:hypothetical protein
MIVHTATKPATIKAPAFDSYAKPIVKALEGFDKATEKLSTTVQTTIQAYIDVCAKNGVAQDKSGVTSIGKAIRECETFAQHIATGFIERKTITEYAQGAMRAYFHAVPFSPTLKNDPAMALPWGKAKEATGGTSNAGATKGKTSREELDKTLSKAIQQARLLGLNEFAANIVDLCLESLDGFKEIE